MSNMLWIAAYNLEGAALLCGTAYEVGALDGRGAANVFFWSSAMVFIVTYNIQLGKVWAMLEQLSPDQYRTLNASWWAKNISFASPRFLKVIYGAGSRTVSQPLKSAFYEFRYIHLGALASILALIAMH